VIVGGPFGPFTSLIARRLRKNGISCTRVLLNGGDLLDWGLFSAAWYRRSLESWGEWIHNRLLACGATDLLVFGDTGPYTAPAIAEARRCGIRVHVLEEGYFRPHWITFQRDGVNGHSPLPKTAEFYREMAQGMKITAPVPVGKITPPSVRAMIWNHCLRALMMPVFPGFRSGYSYGYVLQALSHVARHLKHMRQKRAHQADVHRVIERAGPIFLVLLQRPGDSQLRVHSEFEKTADFIEAVIESFAASAPRDARLVFKAHPLDHGIEPHERDIRRIAYDVGVGDRCSFIEDGHLASLVRCAAGAITVNSTAGLTAIEFGCPVITLGEAVYDIPGLTHQDSLDTFWERPVLPDLNLYHDFRTVMMAFTQINGAYSNRAPMLMAAEAVAQRLTADALGADRSIQNSSPATLNKSGVFEDEASLRQPVQSV
jgi:capsular polysaccharide export protein